MHQPNYLRNLLFIVLILRLLPVSGQSAKKIILDKIQLSIFPDPDTEYGNQGFPAYFEDQSFMKQVYDSIGRYTGEYLHCDTINFDKDYGVYLYLNQYPDRIKPYRPGKTPQGSYKMSLTTYLRYATNDTISDFQLDSRIFMTDDRGKTYIDKMSIVPFSVINNSAITGDTIISRTDFLGLYLDGLKSVFRGSPDTLSRRTYIKPAIHNYDQFINNADYYMSYVENDTYYLEDKDSISKAVLNYLMLEHNKLYSNFYVTRILGDTVKIVDIFTGDMVDLCLEGKRTYSYFYDNYSNIVKAYFKSHDNLTASFEYNDEATLGGIIFGDKIEIRWKPEYQVAEIRIKGELVALLHDLPDHRSVYISRDTGTSVDRIMQLVAVYDFVFIEQQKLNNAPPAESNSALFNF